MKEIFDYEETLVNTFIDNFLMEKNDNILIKEMPIRWGNIDVVSITNNNLPFTKSQMEILSKPTHAKLFLKTKNNRPIKKENLIKNIGASKATCESAVRDLIKNNLIIEYNDFYYRNIDFIFPKVIISGYEAKLKDYKKTFYQSCLNKSYVDLSYMVFPIDVAQKISESKKEILEEHGIGLIGTSRKKSIILIRAKKQEELKPYLRLINLVQSQSILQKLEEASL